MQLLYDYNLNFLDYNQIILSKSNCSFQTNANNKKKTGIIGNTSTIGLKITYASGKRANSKVSINKISIYIKFNNINFTIKISKILILY